MWQLILAQMSGPLAPPAPPGATAPAGDTAEPSVLPWVVAFVLVLGILFLVCMPSRKSE